VIGRSLGKPAIQPISVLPAAVRDLKLKPAFAGHRSKQFSRTIEGVAIADNQMKRSIGIVMQRADAELSEPNRVEAGYAHC
jgi:hypothetical protein